MNFGSHISENERRCRMRNKKGLSDIIATVLIVLLALAAVAIVWGFIRPTFDRAGGAIETSQKCLDAEVRVTSCTTDGDVTVQLVRGDVQRIRAVAYDSGGNTATGDTNTTLGVLGTEQVSTGLTGTVTARAAAIVMDNTNSPYPCDVTPVAVTCE